MARLTIAAAFGVIVGMFGGTLHAARAEEIDDVAAEAGVDPTELLGAVYSTGLEPRAYLRATGELAPPVPPPASGTPYGIWDRLAQCEASGNWHADTGNGFSGGTQTLQSTWIANGGLKYAPAAYMASREQQIAVNERILQSQGWKAWPTCSRILGLR